MSDFRGNIHAWFLTNKRELPWRNTKNPYKIWLSEIILQQTRVYQGMIYYNRFIEKFPTISLLALASEDEILKLWQGLGYYSRARNLHFTAKYIVENFNGRFPTDYKSILNLKGVGPYTAAAISSIAFSLPHATVDGNIYRVLSRYYGIPTPIDSSQGKKEFQEVAEELIESVDPGFHNQALMEFGALQCVPKSPDCYNCPVASTCYAKKRGKVEELPVKSKKLKQLNRYFYYYFIDDGDSTYLEKRTANDIWKNLYQFPLIEFKKPLSEEELLEIEIPCFQSEQANIKSISAEKKHILSHQVIYARVIHIELNNGCSNFIHVNKKDISKFAVSRLMEQFIEELDIDKNKNGYIR